MRILAGLGSLMVCACGGGTNAPREHHEDAAAQADVLTLAQPRLVTSAVVMGGKVAWSELAGRCSSETGAGCLSVGPTVVWSDVQVAVPEAVRQSMTGANLVAGSMDELFVITDDDTETVGLDRVNTSGVVTRLSSDAAVGPAVDNAYVYWFSVGTLASERGIHRATRDGNGVDVVVAANVATPRDIVLTDGWVWWVVDDVNATLNRVLKDGGTPVPIVDQVGTTCSRVDSLLVGRFVNNAGLFEAQMGWVDANGSYHVLVDHLPQNQGARHIESDGDDIYWTALDGNMYRMSFQAPGVPVIVPGAGLAVQLGGVFALVPGRILFNFTDRGFDSLAR